MVGNVAGLGVELIVVVVMVMVVIEWMNLESERAEERRGRGYLYSRLH